MASTTPTIPWTVDLGPEFDFAATKADRKTLKRTTKPYEHQPQSRLLSLAPELRVRIYDLVALGTTTIALKSNRLVVPALGRVCRQIAREYCDVSTLYAPEVARHVKLYCENFDNKHIRQTMDGLARLRNPNHDPDHDDEEESEVDSTVIKVTTVLYLTNEFPRYLTSPPHFMPHTGKSGHIISYAVAFDAKTFDIAFCRQRLPPAVRSTCYSDAGSGNQTGLEKAIVEALDRAEEKQALIRRQHSRKRKR